MRIILDVVIWLFCFAVRKTFQCIYQNMKRRQNEWERERERVCVGNKKQNKKGEMFIFCYTLMPVYNVLPLAYASSSQDSTVLAIKIIYIRHLPYIFNRKQPDASTDYTVHIVGETIGSTAE